MAFVRATKKQAKLRMAIHGVSGAGKTWTSLAIATHLVPDGRVALLDTERGSASKYAHKFVFDVDELAGNYHPDRLIRSINEAAEAGFDVLVIDSLSMFWNGTSGLLELVDAEVAKGRAKGNRGDSFGAWKVVDPIYRRMVQAILAAPLHIIMTMRAKQDYVKETGDNGKTTVRKVGLAPEMRDSFQYEADIEGMLDLDHNLVIGKTRCEALDGQLFRKPGKDVADILRTWLSDGAPASETSNGAPPTTTEKSEPTTPDWLTTILAAFDSADSAAQLKAAEGEAQAYKSEMTPQVRELLLAARKKAQTRVAAQAAQ